MMRLRKIATRGTAKRAQRRYINDLYAAADAAYTDCPACRASGCAVCHDTGLVKVENLRRAQEPLPATAGWDTASLIELWEETTTDWNRDNG